MSILHMIPKIGTPGTCLDPMVLKDKEGSKIVVTGCARSGTQFMKLLLNSPDIKSQVGHERIYPGGIVSWMIVHKNQLNDILHAFKNYDTKWIHIVRNPIKVIQSISRLHVDPRGRIGYQPFLDQFPVYSQVSFDPYLLGVFNWIEWNLLIDKKLPIDLRLKVEDIHKEAEMEKLSELLSIPRETLLTNISRLGNKCHSFPDSWEKEMDEILGTKFSLEYLYKKNRLIVDHFIEIAHSFGYPSL